jgi:hypothetical protein
VRRLIVVLTLIALVMRAAVPAGFMLGPVTADGELQIVICTANGAKFISANDSASRSGADHTATSDSCAWAAPTSLSASTGQDPLVVTIVWADVEFKRAVEQRSETPRPSAQSARGPPHVLI